MKKPGRPALQVCPLCATTDDVTLSSDGPDLWRFTCAAEGDHHPYEWVPTGQVLAEPGRNAAAEDLGVYDELLRCVHAGELVEYGIVEHRFAAAMPDVYRQLVDRYGHRSLKPSSYTASAFLSHALGQLAREGLLVLSWTKGTGYWDYLDRVSAWRLPGEPDAAPTSWSEFAAREGIDEQSWPATDGSGSGR